MKALDRKLFRDFARLWALGLAIALVLAAGVATLVLASGAARSLIETRAAYYERYSFADIFAAATRAPMNIARDLEAIPGVARVEPRIREGAIIDVEGQQEPATGVFLSLPRSGQPGLNAFYLREGRFPDPDARDEVMANEAFVKAHGFRPGASFEALLNGRKRRLTITGVMMSPEFIYAISPGDLVPDDRRFGVFAMPYDALAAITDLDGAFNNVSLALLRGASAPAVIDAVDRVLDRYGGAGAYGREDHVSHAFLDAELNQLQAMTLIIPPIFLAVAAFLVNITVMRLVTLEREQIGLMKAMGYGDFAVGAHYLKLVGLIAVVGVVIGWGVGRWMGRGLAEMYGLYFQFPFLIFLDRLDIYAIAAFAALAAALGGALKAVRGVMALPPAVAMSPPAPPRYRRFLLDRLGVMRRLPAAATMALRSVSRWPARAGLTMLGLSASIAVLIGSLFAFDSMERIVETTYFTAERQDASVGLIEPRSLTALSEIRRLPGVMQAEPFRAAAVELAHGHLTERASIMGKPRGADLSRVVDLSLAPVELPETGIALSEMLAGLLKVSRGDEIEVRFLTGRRETRNVRVTAVIQQYLGLGAYMEIGALNRLLREGDQISGAHVALDRAREAAFHKAVKGLPALSGLALQTRSREKFRETLDQNIGVMTAIYTSLAVVIGFGVVYNFVRIQLSERARELASLRILGFTKGETAATLFAELTLLAIIAIPVGWGLGWALAWSVTLGLQSELYRVPLVVSRATYGWATLIYLAVVVASALLVRRRLDRLDLISVLKTRD